MSWGRAWMTDSVADDRIAKARRVGLPDDGDLALEESRVKAIQQMLDSGDADERARALTHIERMSGIRQQVRQDTLKHAEAAVEVEAAQSLVRADERTASTSRTPERLSAELAESMRLITEGNQDVERTEYVGRADEGGGSACVGDDGVASTSG